MKKIYLFVVSLFFVFVFSCTNEKHLSSYTIPANAKPYLADSEILDYENANAIKENVTEDNAEIAQNLIIYAKSLMTEKGHEQETLKALRQAVAYYPNIKTYYELGDYLLKTRDINGSRASLDLAFTFNVSQKRRPKDKSRIVAAPDDHLYPLIHYDMAQNYAIQKDTGSTIEYLNIALANGYKDEAQINNQKEFQFLKPIPEFKALMVDHFANKEDRSSLFASFKSGFPKATLPYSVEQPNHLFNKETELSYNFHAFIPAMENPRYSREAIDEFSPVAILASTSNYTLLLYVSRVQFMDTITRVTLASFDPKGNLLDTLVLASSNTEDFATGTISADHKIKVLCYNKVWKNDPLEEGFDDNYVIRRDLVQTKIYELDKTGFFYRKGIITNDGTAAVKD